ncbi:MAG: cupin domain-containing protein [Abitibacteriaceae bacterium]|nr:cupin domain-containing protein [Abditibacteriaceae bacterium]MBV9868853.1 cupin domain-containing protein [Abditibacteriaceae bacterium]
MQVAELNGVFTGQGRGEAVNVLGIAVEILLPSEATGGAFTTYLMAVEPGFGPPLHVHSNDDECFYVLDGEFEVRCGDETTIVRTGDQAFLPRHTPHTFRNVGTQTGHLLGFGTPGGHEEFFRDANRLSFPPDPEAATAVCRKHGLELVGP